MLPHRSSAALAARLRTVKGTAARRAQARLADAAASGLEATHSADSSHTRGHRHRQPSTATAAAADADDESPLGDAEAVLEAALNACSPAECSILRDALAAWAPAVDAAALAAIGGGKASPAAAAAALVSSGDATSGAIAPASLIIAPELWSFISAALLPHRGPHLLRQLYTRHLHPSSAVISKYTPSVDNAEVLERIAKVFPSLRIA
jgi:hypothetical protein